MKEENNEENEENEENNYPENYNKNSFMRGRGWWVVLIVIVGLIILGALSEFITVGYNVRICYNEQVPEIQDYWDTESYPDQNCYDKSWIWEANWGTPSTRQICLQQDCARFDQVCAEKNFWGNCIRYNDVCASYKCIKYNNYCQLNLENKEEEGLNVQIQLQKWNNDMKSAVDLSYKTDYYVNPLDTLEVKWEYTSISTESFACMYKVLDYPTKNECETVIRERQVEKQRTIMKKVPREKVEVRQCNLWKKVIGRCYDTSEGC